MLVKMHLKQIVALILLIFAIGCKDKVTPFYKLSGPTMGTKYNIAVQTETPEKVQASIDSILNHFNLSMSSYIDTSTLSFFNAADSVFCFSSASDPYFVPIFEKSKEVYQKTSGVFNPAIAPLVDYYGFGYKEKKPLKAMDTLKIKELLKLLVFDSVFISKDSQDMICIHKPNKDIKLDFNSISPGYAVDVIARFLEKAGMRNFMIELGGEVRTMGLNDKNKEWVIGINKPKEGAKETEIELPLQISNKSLATSGNYRNMYESKGQKFAHIINPITGISQPTDILSATVIADDCMSADAYATAFMVLGLKKSLELVEQLNGIEACFIYDNEGDGVFEFSVSNGFSKFYLHNEQQ